MNLINALYTIQLLPTKRNGIYSLHRITKIGDTPLLNKLLAWKDTVKFKKLEPTGMLPEYVVYPLTLSEKGQQQLYLLETAPYLYPYGVVNAAGSPDCTLFRISEDLTIEFYVSEGNANLTAQLLTMLVNGTLSEDIDNLKN